MSLSLLRRLFSSKHPQRTTEMNTAINKCLDTLMQINGAQAVALVDYESGMLLGEAGSGVDMELAAAGNTEVLRAKMKTAEALNLNDSIEDILITLGRAYQVLRQKANLALASRMVLDVESSLALKARAANDRKGKGTPGPLGRAAPAQGCRPAAFTALEPAPCGTLPHHPQTTCSHPGHGLGWPSSLLRR